MSDHADCGTPLTALLPHEGGDVASKAAYASILDRAIQAYTRGHEEALRLWRLEDEGLHQNALAAVLPNVGTAFAAAALLRAARLVSDKGSAAILEGLAAELDLQVVESLEGTSEDTTLPRGET